MQGLSPASDLRPAFAGQFSSLPSYRLHLLAGMSARNAEIRFEQLLGFRMIEARIVGLVGTYGSLSLKEICREADLEKSNASCLVTRLIDGEFLERIEHDADQRIINVSLTEKGRQAYNQIYSDACRRNEDWLSALTKDEQAVFLTALEKLLLRTREMIGQDASTRPVSQFVPSQRSDEETVPIDTQLARQLHLALVGFFSAQPSAG